MRILHYLVGMNAEERIIDVCVTSCGSPASSVCIPSYRDKEPQTGGAGRSCVRSNTLIASPPTLKQPLYYKHLRDGQFTVCSF